MQTVSVPTGELIAQAQQISSLIAEGNLEKAKARLEETISKRLESSGSGSGQLPDIDEALSSSQQPEAGAPAQESSPRPLVSPTAPTQPLVPDRPAPPPTAAAELPLQAPARQPPPAPGSASAKGTIARAVIRRTSKTVPAAAIAAAA